jgi:hypothetical protein
LVLVLHRNSGVVKEHHPYHMLILSNVL